jgi:hypothetical protein
MLGRAGPDSQHCLNMSTMTQAEECVQACTAFRFLTDLRAAIPTGELGQTLDGGKT